MKILNYYFSSTGNTEKVALSIRNAAEALSHSVTTLQITRGDVDIDVLKYRLVFVGSGVYSQLPGQALIELHRSLLLKYSTVKEIIYASPRRQSAYVVVYCTYGGVHTGINEAIPAVKYMGQLFDHLGYTIVGEWYVVGDYKTEGSLLRSIRGRLGDIRGRPNKADLQAVAERVKGILTSCSS
ncbi:MAG: flavodoxin [Candidatus Bathyarchaeota archaeon]|nr:MAG: flavodoxin [Candidatus Bathyarchaeota archaeon]